MKRYYKQIGNQTVFFDGVLVVDNMQIINPSEEQILENGWQEYIEPTPPTPTEEELLETAKYNKISEIEEYNDSDDVNSFTIGETEMWLNPTIRQQLRISIEAYQAMNIENVSKWFDGVEYTFTTSQWLQMLNLLEVYAAEALNVTESHKAAVNALESIEEVEEYDITDGYPQKLVF